MSAAGAEVVVVSEKLPLPWQTRRGKVPGTAVFYGDALCDVVDSQPAAPGWRWRLVPWREGEVIHGSL